MYAPKRRWVVAAPDRALVRTLSAELGIPPLAAHLLVVRGVFTVEEGRGFLEPSLDALCDPFSLTDMAAAVERIRRARDAGERVLVFGDYDVDGITAAALLYRGLLRFGLREVECGMPERLAEGYGLNAVRVEAAKAGGFSLIVTVDNGIRAYEAAVRARELGVDLIVTDHHAVDGPLPEAVAVVNPKREAETHPAYHLCGAGVAFKLAQALNGTKNDLDIAAIGTVADIVPLTGENRVITALGLRHMARHRRLGLAQLAAAARLDVGTLRASQIAFQLGPRLNAAGRMGEGLPALRLLLSEDEAEARRIARDLNEANEERRAVETAIYTEIMDALAGSFSPAQRTIVMGDSSWHGGVIGIVASRVQHRYNRPVVLMSMEGDVVRGSARGIPGFDTVGAFAACEDLLIQYGGHKAAAGFSIQQERVPEFKVRFEEEGRRQLGEGDLPAELPIDALAMFSEVDGALMNAIAHLEPVGHMNPAPVLCSCGVECVPRSARILKEAHLKLSVRQDGCVFDAIGFGMADRFHPDALPGRLDIAYTPEFNTWNGNTCIQLVLKDLRPAQ